jgi:hypothetical protein
MVALAALRPRALKTCREGAGGRGGEREGGIAPPWGRVGGWGEGRSDAPSAQLSSRARRVAPAGQRLRRPQPRCAQGGSPEEYDLTALGRLALRVAQRDRLSGTCPTG